MLFQSLQTLLKVENGFLMKEKELIERIQNYTFNIGVTLIINNNTYYTNRELTSSVIYCCNKVNDEWLIYDEGPEDKSDMNDKYFYFKSNIEDEAIDFFFNRLMREDRIYARRLQKKELIKESQK